MAYSSKTQSAGIPNLMPKRRAGMPREENVRLVVLENGQQFVV